MRRLRSGGRSDTWWWPARTVQNWGMARSVSVSFHYQQTKRPLTTCMFLVTTGQTVDLNKYGYMEGPYGAPDASRTFRVNNKMDHVSIGLECTIEGQFAHVYNGKREIGFQSFNASGRVKIFFENDGDEHIIVDLRGRNDASISYGLDPEGRKMGVWTESSS